MDVTFFEGQPYYPKIEIQGEKTSSMIESAEFQQLEVEIVEPPTENVITTEGTNSKV